MLPSQLYGKSRKLELLPILDSKKFFDSNKLMFHEIFPTMKLGYVIEIKILKLVIRNDREFCNNAEILSEFDE